MSALPRLPPHKLSESPNSRAIEIGEWVITAKTNPISNASECDALQATLQGMPLPEMTFGNNALELEHKPSGWKYLFQTENALREVKNGALVDGDGGVKVGYADAWLKSRCVLSDIHASYIILIKAAQANPHSSLCLIPSQQNRTIGHIPQLILDRPRMCRQVPCLGVRPMKQTLGISSRWRNSRARIPSCSTQRSPCLKTSSMIMALHIF